VSVYRGDAWEIQINRRTPFFSKNPAAQPAVLEGREMSKQRKPSPKTGNTSFNPTVYLETTGKGHVISTCPKGQVIFAQGNAADAVFYIKSGRVKISIVSKHGKEAIVALPGPDEFLGEGCLTGQSSHRATATSLTDCVIMRMEKSEIQRLLKEETEFSQMFISHMLTRITRVQEDLVDQLFNSTEKRLARVLLLLANFGKEGRPEPIATKISQETLAEMIGATRSRVSQLMNNFRRLGFIDYNGHLEVYSSLLSVVLDEQPNTVKPRR
jgi:CRP/FNR family cyclic AMP-dependent transcriptional regulator